MAGKTSFLDAVAALAAEMASAGFEPVLVGGMALVTLGSQRVTRDFDFLVTTVGPPREELISMMYRHHLELVTKFNLQGEAVRTVDNVNVAAAKIKSEDPRSLSFYDRRSGLRVDLLLDFPIAAHACFVEATRMTVGEFSLRVATRRYLLRLKEIARVHRKSAADDHDLEFLRHLDAK